MEDSYITNDPILYAVIVAAIFAFTSAVFLLYDFLVEKRQTKVMDKAVKSTAVVTSLFPEAVHERLFADAQSAELSKEMNAWKAASADMSLQRQPTVADLMRRSGGQANAPDLGLMTPKSGRKGKPIADKFPDTTVLFADLAGFTKWSSTREPEHVFILLETLYGAFDKVAVKRKVFKVETIGDCYMAVTGLPNPQPDHAVRMAKFARDCIQRMERLVNELSMSLGRDTKELIMRTGMHSGPVTAGVLRGDKGRFQLFGDTVNTASRMESNGIKGRIHVSESTAMLLPQKWLTEREDKITAKGKGEMTTYFVDADMGGRSSIASAAFDHVDLGFENDSQALDGTTRDIDSSSFSASLHSASTRRASLTFSVHSATTGKRRVSKVDEMDEFQQSFAKDLSSSSQARSPPTRTISFEDEPEQSVSHSKAPQRFSALAFGMSLAEKMGITDEIEC